jgi:hypothetical protein
MQKVRVTVIATGFPATNEEGTLKLEEEEALLERIEMEAPVRDEYDVPTFLRKARRTELR